VHTDARQGEQARKKDDKCVALHGIAASQNRSHDRHPEERATQETARLTPSRASLFAGPRLCHIRCRIHRDAPRGRSTRLRYRNAPLSEYENVTPGRTI